MSIVKPLKAYVNNFFKSSELYVRFFQKPSRYSNYAIGMLGEQIAVKYLVNQGYGIIARNVRTKKGEIDIIARISSELVFFEVKTRVSKENYLSETNFDSRKREKVKTLADSYQSYFKSVLKKQRIRSFRLDLVAVELHNKPGKKKFDIFHYQSV
jgi:putative endonuclease